MTAPERGASELHILFNSVSGIDHEVLRVHGLGVRKLPGAPGNGIERRRETDRQLGEERVVREDTRFVPPIGQPFPDRVTSGEAVPPVGDTVFPNVVSRKDARVARNALGARRPCLLKDGRLVGETVEKRRGLVVVAVERGVCRPNAVEDDK